MDPYLIAAGGFVLAGLGCLGADLYNIATPSHNSAELWSAEAVDLAAGLAAAGALIYEGGLYLTIVGSYIAKGEYYRPGGLSRITYALALAESLEMFMGFGTPYQGDDLRHGAQQLTALSEQLQGTTPGSGWRGAAAQAYTEQVGAEQGAAGVLATIDLGFADLAQQCADFVTHARLAIGLLKSLLVAGYAIERMWYAEENPDYGWTFSGKVGVAGALAVGAIGFTFGVYFANELKDGAGEVGKIYDKVGQQPPPPGAVTAAATTESSVAGPAQRSGDRRFFFDAEAESATLFPEATPSPAPQPSSARPGLRVSVPTFAAPAGPGQPVPRGHTRSAPQSEPNAEPVAPPVEDALPDFEVGRRAPVAAPDMGRSPWAARVPTPAS